jgi:hypothetical protein
MRSIGNLAWMRRREIAHRLLTGKPEIKKPLGRIDVGG